MQCLTIKKMADDILESKLQKSPKNHKILKGILFIVVVLLLMGASGYGTYAWQHKKLDAANTKISADNSQIASLNKNNQTLDAKLSTLNTQYKQVNSALSTYEAAASVTPANLKLTVNDGAYVYPDGTVPAGGHWFGVNVTITNPTSSTIKLVTADYKLKDPQQNEFQEFGDAGASTLPAGWVDLQDQTLAAGETVKGVLLFPVTNTSIQSYTLVNGTQSYPVPVNPAP